MRRRMRDSRLCSNLDCSNRADLREVVHLTHGAKYYFCSPECRQKWQHQETREDVHRINDEKGSRKGRQF